MNHVLHHPARPYVLAALLGLLLPQAYAPYDRYPLLFLSLTGLFALGLGKSSRQNFRLGWCYGLAAFATGLSWLHISIHHYGGVPWPVSILICGLLAAFMALFPAAALALARYLGAGQPRWQLWLLPPCWLLFEWLRGTGELGFPWFLLGYSQLDGPLSGWAPILGVYGISLLFALTASLTLLLLRMDNTYRYRLLCCTLLALLATGSGKLQSQRWTSAQGAPLKAGLVQGFIPQDKKWLVEEKEPTLQRYWRLSRMLTGVDLVLWPETAIPGFMHRHKKLLQRIQQQARHQHQQWLVGILKLQRSTLNYYNSLLLLGQHRQLYYKRHLVPFTETLPLYPLTSRLLDAMGLPYSDFSRGQQDQPLLQLTGHKALASICFEDAFVSDRLDATGRANLLINATNDAWFADSNAPIQHLQIARMRALESGRPMLRVTNTGISALIDDRGQILQQSGLMEQAVLQGSIQPMQGRTPYLSWGHNWFISLSALLLVGRWLHLQRRQSRQASINS